MNAPWTALGTPAISIPLATPNGLPLGLQLTADRGEDARLLRVAVWAQDMLVGERVARSPVGSNIEAGAVRAVDE